jgi:hypothetical protein
MWLASKNGFEKLEATRLLLTKEKRESYCILFVGG